MCSDIYLRISLLQYLSHISQLCSNIQLRIMMNLLLTIVYLSDKLRVLISHLIVSLRGSLTVTIFTAYFFYLLFLKLFLLSCTTATISFMILSYYLSSLMSCDYPLYDNIPIL